MASDAADALQVLRRVDPEVDEVLATAGHVCLYYMHVTSQQWTRKNVEGSLFLLKRRTAPRFQMLVLNKLATENYQETIHGSFDFEVQAPYLMYTHGNSEIHGIWFYEQDDLNRLFTLLNRIKSGLPKADILPSTAAAGAPEPTQPDKAFWDKQVDVSSSSQVPMKPDMQATPEAPAQSGNQHFASMLKQAHKQQQQQHQQPTPPPPQPQGDASPPLLTPSFFQSQSQQGAGVGSAAAAAGPASRQLLANAKQEAHLSPAPSGALGTQQHTGHDNMLQKLFSKAVAPPPTASPSPVSQHSHHTQSLPPGLVPTAAALASTTKRAAPPPAPQQQQAQVQPPPPPPAGAPQTNNNPLAKLFNSAAATGSGAAAAARAPGPAPPRTSTPNLGVAAGGVKHEVTRARVRAAFAQLLANDAFVDMVSEQFRAAGLITE